MKMHQSFTMSANLNIGKNLLTSVSYTAANQEFDNLGAGIAFKVSVFQFYIISDRIPLKWNKVNIDRNEFILPANWKTVDIRAGVNLVFRKSRNDEADDECRNMAEIEKHFPAKHKKL